MPEFTVDQIADLTGRVCIVTGANTGIGYITALELAKKGCRVIVACRDEKRAQTAIENMKTAAQPTEIAVEFMPLDLNSLKSVREFAAAFIAMKLPLHILVNNAGIMALPSFETTADGIEKQLGVNHVGHFELTRLLLPTLKSSAPSRIVCVSSMAHNNAPNNVNFEDAQDPKKYGALSNYGMSKLANILFARQLAKNLAADGCDTVHVNALHPGVINTELWRNMNWIVQKVAAPFMRCFALTPFQGALTSLYLAGHPDIDAPGMTGKYFVPYAKEAQPKPQALDDALAERLWTFTEKLIAEHGPK